MTVREKTRLEKFRQLLSSHNTDLGAFTRALSKVVLWRLWFSEPGTATVLTSFTSTRS